MEQWDKEFIDLVEEGHITFEKKNREELHFGAVDCDLDCRIEKVRDQERIEFSFVAWTKAMKYLAEDEPYCKANGCVAGSIFTMEMSPGS